ncbi:MAG: primosomal protein N' [Epulopiscium sp. Nele67-Bin005]|nr:MAG: primosomal protein N' [Epulopiscium sp. Nele67-Bin005]
MNNKLYGSVILSHATNKEIDQFFSYIIPIHLYDEIKIGSRVKVPFGKGNKTSIGYLLQISNITPEGNFKIKEIISIIDAYPILNETQIELAKFLINYYGATCAGSLNVMLPPALNQKPIEASRTTQTFVNLLLSVEEAKIYSDKLKGKQVAILELFIKNNISKLLLSYITSNIENCSSALNTLIKKDILKKELVQEEYIFEPINNAPFKTLNSEQEISYQAILSKVQSDKFATFLLEGVTGSGKTEIFLHVIRDALLKNKTAIVLVPEIALTQQTLSRFKERFGNRVALTHSRMTAKQRQNLYLLAKEGKVQIVIGPRSAVFMPLPNLGVIIVDEEHDTSYKSADASPKYNAIEVAKKYMELQNGVVVLASATPSFETYKDAVENTITHLTLTKRTGQSIMPYVEIVDMRNELKDGNAQVISRYLHQAIELTLNNNDQVMLLLNRRGHSTFINCRNCGFVVKCIHCDVSMTYHKTDYQLVCHHCASLQEVPKTCPSCGSKFIRFFGNGTQKVEDYLNIHFEKFGVGRMDFDTTSKKDGHEKILTQFRNREINILIGTQMIAKGHDFEKVTLMGIISADQSLHTEDFRSRERTFQLLTQTLGRAGRGEKQGFVVIQSYTPEHEVLQDVKFFNQKNFYQNELNFRKKLGYPPYNHIFSILIYGTDEDIVIKKVHQLKHYFDFYNKKKLFRLLGPTKASLAKIADNYRWKITILGHNREILLMYGKYCINKFSQTEDIKQIKLSWDIDPLNVI